MAKIKKIAQVKRIETIKTNMQYLKQEATRHKKEVFYKSYRKKEQLKKRELTIEQHLEQLKQIVRIYHDNLTIAKAYEYTDPVRIKRAKEQLRVYYLSNFTKGVFNFVVKSSGLTPENKAYFVRLQFKEVDLLAPLIENKPQERKEILLNSRIGVECSCEDFQYRFRYWLTQMKALPDGAIKELRYPKITNPHGEHKLLCKHIVLVLNGVQKPSFKDGIFARYIDKVKQKGPQASVKVTEKDKLKTLQASLVNKVKGPEE